MIYQELKKLERGMKLFCIVAFTLQMLIGLFISNSRTYEIAFSFLIFIELCILGVAVLLEFYIGNKHKFNPLTIFPNNNKEIEEQKCSVVVNLFDEKGYSRKGFYNYYQHKWVLFNLIDDDDIKVKYWSYIETPDKMFVSKTNSWDIMDL